MWKYFDYGDVILGVLMGVTLSKIGTSSSIGCWVGPRAWAFSVLNRKAMFMLHLYQPR